MEFNTAQREVTLKVVYYGPALSGKTSNLEALHRMLDPAARGGLTTIDTSGDRTLFFDLLPLNFSTRSGVRVKVKLFTVPGQVVHESTRRIVLLGTDAVIFVADSQRASTVANNTSFRNLHKHLRANGLDPARVPTVIQFNKRDLPDIRTKDELIEIAKRGSEPIYEAVAIRGEGVIETLRGLIDVMWKRLDAEHAIGRKLGLVEDELMGAVFGSLRASKAPGRAVVR